MKILVTGCAGFIGVACSKALLERGDEVVGVDNLNDYYDISLKQARLNTLQKYPQFQFHLADLKDIELLNNITKKAAPHKILHLAAQAGVRYSITNPLTYVDSNLVGFAHILEIARSHNIEHLVFASSSSVYGANSKLPYSIEDNVDHPISLYAATKKSNELMAHAYAYLYKIPVTGLRFFTVYGPWGRPDMAPIKFASKIMHDQPIEVYNYGDHSRDFTYIDDIVSGVLLVLDKPPCNLPPYRLYNIGRGKPVQLLKFIEILEQNLGKKAIRKMLPKQLGDVDSTWADIKELSQDFAYQPKISLETGIAHFTKWFMEYYYKVKN